MAPQTSATDLILSIYPQHVQSIVRRTKNHEFRSYLLPPSIKRLWIYETSPTSSIRFVATIGPAKQPGEIRNPSGLLNDEFDRGDLKGRVKYAYEIRRLEELPKPYTLDELKNNGWLNGAPQKYCFVKPSMDQALRSVQLDLIFDATSAAATFQSEKDSALHLPTIDTPTVDIPTVDIPTVDIVHRVARSTGVRKSKRRRATDTSGKHVSLEHWLVKRSAGRD